MNIIAHPSMPAGELEMPQVPPTSRLTSGMLFLVRERIEPKGKLTCFMSWVVRDRILHWNLDTPAMKANLKAMFDLELDETPPRHDFVNGWWTARQYPSLEWYNAGYEDAVIKEGDAVKAVVRFARVGQFDPKKEPCSATPPA